MSLIFKFIFLGIIFRYYFIQNQEKIKSNDRESERFGENYKSAVHGGEFLV